MKYILMSDFTGKSAHVLRDMAKEKAKELGIVPVLFPENDLHSQFHMELADELLKKGDDALTVTHSENFILRIMRRIERGDIKNTEVTVLILTPYINKKDKGFAYWKELCLDEEGEFIDHINGGFFEQGYNERFNMGDISPLKV